MTDRIRGTQPTATPTPRPAPTPTPTPTAPMANAPAVVQRDNATLSATATEQLAANDDPFRPAALEANGYVAGVQTAAQGGTRAAAANTGNARLTRAADLLDGDNKAVGGLVGRWIAAARQRLPQLLGRHGDDAVRGFSRLAVGAGHALRFVGKVAPVLNVIAASYDTYKAATERDPAARTAAWTNAALSIASTGAALLALATPAGWVAGAVAGGIAAFQLVDNLAFGGRGTRWLGENVGAPIANAAKSAWNAITSL